MRKIKYFVANSLDNYIARKNGAVDWLFMDGTDYGMGDFFKSIDAILLGRKTYEIALSQNPRSRNSKSNFGMKSYIFSRTLKLSPGDGAQVISQNAGAFVRSLKMEEGKDIWLMGGGELMKSLLLENVVDEISLNIHPLLLGSGVFLFPELDKQIDLELINSNIHKNGCIQVTYRIKDQAPRQK